MKKRNVKGLVIGLLTITMLGTVLVGCSGTDTKPVDTTIDDEIQEEVEDVQEDVIGVPEVDIGHRVLLINELIEYDTFTVKITGYNLAKDKDGKDALVITYDWENKSTEPQSPVNTFDIRGFQDSGETGLSADVDGIDVKASEKEYKTGEKLEGGKTSLAIHHIDKDLLVELDELSPDSKIKHSSTVKVQDLK